MITSRANSRIKALAALKQARHRRETGLTLVEGIHLVQEAMAAQDEMHNGIRTLIISPDAVRRPESRVLLEQAEDARIEILEVSCECYAKISGLRSPEGIAVVFAFSQASLDDLCNDAKSRLLVAAGLQDPGNAGALVRVAEAAGASGCVFVDSIDLSGPRFLRATMGSCFRLPCARANMKEFVNCAKNLRLLPAVGNSPGTDFQGADYTPPVAVCIGAEGTGLAPELLALSQERVFIPMCGRVESLNAAVAAGIILYQARETWNRLCH